MKIYIFNLVEDWTVYGAEAIVAKNKEDAIKLYDESGEKYTVEEVEIVNGLCLEASGYDDVDMLWEIR